MTIKAEIKRLNLREGEEALEKLVAWDYKVYQFAASHFRINDRLDVWPSTKRWYDTVTRVSGTYIDLEHFVRGYKNLKNERI